MSTAIIVTYDISNDKTRTRFSKYLEKFGVRIQFSVFEIQNTKRILDIVCNDIEHKFKKQFEAGDSIYVFKTDVSEALKYGSAQLLNNNLIIL